MIVREPFSSAEELISYIYNNILQFDGVKYENINTKGIFGSTPLQIVVEQDTADEVAFEEAKLLIDSGADVNCKGEMDVTPLHAAAQRGRLKIVEYLLENGAQNGPRDQFGQTAAEAAEYYGHLNVAALLRQSEVGRKGK